MTKYTVLICFTIIFYNAFSQVDNYSISDNETVYKENANQWGVGLNSFNYLRNTEYFNLIESGQTLFGTQLIPSFWFQPDSNLKFKMGVFLNHHFGSNQIKPILPVFSLIYKNNNHQFIFGTINGATSHALLEPIFNINNAIEQRIEQGAQYTLNAKKNWMDVWINWQKYMPYKGLEHERFTSGLNFKTALLKTNAFGIDISNQLLLSHKGGQLSKDTTPQTSSIQAVTGFDFNNKNVNKNFYFIFSMHGLLSYIDTPNAYSNFALMSNFSINGNKKYNGLSLILTYFRGYDFFANTGTYIYQNISRDSGLKIYSNRELLFFRFIYQYMISRQNNYPLNISARLEPFYDFNTKLLEYSYSLYLTYNLNIKIGKLF